MVNRRFCVMCQVTKDGVFFRFPLEVTPCRQWVQLSGNLDLVYVPIEKLHAIRYVCSIHFQKRDYTKTGKFLKKTAVPSLSLPSTPLTDDQLRDFPFHVKSAVTPASISDTAVASTSAITPSFDLPPASTMDTAIASTSDTAIASTSSTAIASTSDTAIASTSDTAIASTSIINKSIDLPSASTFVMLTTQSTSYHHQQLINKPVSDVASSGTGCPQVLKDVTSSFQNVAEVHTKQLIPSSVTRREYSITENKLLEELKCTKNILRTLKRNAQNLENLESPVLKEIIKMALKNHKRKPKGRRWSPTLKISCLSIFKRSPKAYRYLSEILPFPSIKTLQAMLKKMPLQPGINYQLFNYLKKNKKIRKADKLCCLLFDEMALKRRLIYNVAMDKVDGYTDLGNNERSSELADHALVFMIQGLKTRYKQPVAFYLVKGTISSHNLANIILDIIKAASDAGFTVLATVCDQGPTNMGALKILKNLTAIENNNYFVCNSKQVYILFDVPHLFKSIRNNFLNYGLIKYENKIGKWDHLRLVEEKNRECMLYLSKVSPMHVQPKYRAKMKVKYAAQILSNTVSAVLKLIASPDSYELKSEMLQTANIITELDRLFDCTNGPSGPNDIKKGIRENVSKNTNHLELWAHFRKSLETVHFFKTNGVTAKNARCIQGYITTLQSLRDIWLTVKNKGQKYLNLRQLNQDALENLFGVIRQHNPTDRNPTPTMFMAALKTSVISGLTSHSKGFNCLKDSNKLLFDFQEIIFDGSPNSKLKETELENTPSVLNDEVGNVSIDEDDTVLLSLPEVETEDESVHNINQAVIYVAGYIASNVLKKIKCKQCRLSLITENPSDENTMYLYIRLREWWGDKKSLTYPTSEFCQYVNDAVHIFEDEVIHNFHSSNINSLTITLFVTKCRTSFLKCVESDHKNIFININKVISLMLIRRQCKRINSRLLIEEQKVKDIVKRAEQGQR